MGKGRDDPIVADRMIRILTMIIILGIFITQIVHVAGGGVGHTVLARAEEALRNYPTDQMERSIHGTFSTLENMHQISSRAKFLMDHVEPEEVKQLAKRVTAISDADIQSTLQVLSNLNRLLTTVDAKDLGLMVKNMRMISEHMNATRLNQLIDSTNAIENRLKSLNEIKLRF